LATGGNSQEQGAGSAREMAQGFHAVGSVVASSEWKSILWVRS
jgi:hypothetical protein